MYQAMATVMRCWSRFEQQGEEEVIEQMREALAALEATGTAFVRPHFLALLAEALAKARHYEEGLRMLEDALSSSQRNGHRYYQAELYRVKGELLLMQSKGPGVTRAAEGCFKESVKIAQQQKAKSWELRAVMSMARLHQNKSKQAETRSLLTQIYCSFTEGFDTVELREAKTLLENPRSIRT
jgi:predicted ATPase